MSEFILNTDENVYIPAEDSYLLAENLEIKEGASVLEIGTGSGIVAMYASRLTDKITVTDINFDACELARKNFEDNNIENIEKNALAQKWINDQSLSDNYWSKNTKWKIQKDGE